MVQERQISPGKRRIMTKWLKKKEKNKNKVEFLVNPSGSRRFFSSILLGGRGRRRVRM